MKKENASRVNIAIEYEIPLCSKLRLMISPLFLMKARERRDGRVEDNDAEDAAKMSSDYRAVAPTETECAAFRIYIIAFDCLIKSI